MLGAGCIEAARYLKNELHEFDLASQLSRSGTSVGANIREAFCGVSDKEFVVKLQISLKECSETEYWLELLDYCDMYHNDDLLSLCREVYRILTASIKTAKEKLAKKAS